MVDEETKSFSKCLVRKGEKNYKSFVKEVISLMRPTVIAIGLGMIVIIGIYLLGIIASYLAGKSLTITIFMIFILLLVEGMVGLVAIVDEMRHFIGTPFKRFVNAMLNIHISLIQFCWWLIIVLTSVIPVFMLLAILSLLYIHDPVIGVIVVTFGGILLSPLNYTVWQCLNCEKYANEYKPSRVQYWK